MAIGRKTKNGAECWRWPGDPAPRGYQLPLLPSGPGGVHGSTVAGTRPSPPASADGVFMMAEREGFEPSIGCPIHAFQACAFVHSATSPDQHEYWQMHGVHQRTERVGFEPTVGINLQRISNPPPSTTRPPLHNRGTHQSRLSLLFLSEFPKKCSKLVRTFFGIHP